MFHFLASAFGAFAQEFTVPERNTDILGIFIGSDNPKVDQALGKYAKTDLTSETQHGETLHKFTLDTELYNDEVFVAYSKDMHVSGVSRKITYIVDKRPSIDNWSVSIERKYGRFSYVENGPGFTNIYWDYALGAQIPKESTDAEHRIVVNLDYDQGFVHSINFSLITTDKMKKPDNGEIPL